MSDINNNIPGTKNVAIMYVDESGTPDHNDSARYFILSGVIVLDEHIKKLERAVSEYKQSNFTGDYLCSEIHTRNIYRSKEGFSAIDRPTRIRLLDNLYGTIGSIECAGIVIVVDKCKLPITPQRSVLNAAWSFLLERYDMFLRENPAELGHIKADMSYEKTQKTISDTARRLIGSGTGHGRLDRVTQPVFVNSADVCGIQVADAFAYCALKRKTSPDPFSRYWEVVCGKLLRGRNGGMRGYGYKKHPE